MQDLSIILQEALNNLDNDLLKFQEAKNGDINSFVYLITKYGKYAQHKISFLINDSCEVILGCCFSCDQDYIYYDFYGKYSRKKRFSFKYHSFDRLISIIY